MILWNKYKEIPSLHTKFEALWIGPYEIEKVIVFNSYIIMDLDGTIHKFTVNGDHLKDFFT